MSLQDGVPYCALAPQIGWNPKPFYKNTGWNNYALVIHDFKVNGKELNYVN
jgi:hypothetical protein